MNLQISFCVSFEREIPLYICFVRDRGNLHVHSQPLLFSSEWVTRLKWKLFRPSLLPAYSTHIPWLGKLLNYIVLNKYLFFFVGVLEEAEFYNIDPLVRIIKDRIQSREARQKLPVSFVLFKLCSLKCIFKGQHVSAPSCDHFGDHGKWKNIW